jgi:DNA helicase II / ATP-dependent DNA helicase PcrA
VRLTGYCVRDLQLDPKRFPPRSVHHAISAAKNDLVTPAGMTDLAGNPHDRKLAEVYAEYQGRLAKAGAMDFDDLLTVTVRLFREHPDVLAHYQQRFRHVLVDEYQDTNKAQNEIVLLLAGGATGHRNVTVVGDHDQSIYRFRGADISNIMDFEHAFPDATVITLSQNYRSTQTILDAANAVIEQNTNRKPKHLWTESGHGDRIVRYHADDEGDEAQWVAHVIARGHDRHEHRYGDVAVFYRTNAQSRVLEDAFTRAGIPYRVIGGQRFYDRREIKDALAYLRVLVNPADEVSVKRVINVPKRGIGDTTVARLDVYAASRGITFAETLASAPDAGVSGPALRGIDAFRGLINEHLPLVERGPAVAMQSLLDASGYLAELEADRSIENEGRLENVNELIGFAQEYDTIDEFLERIALVTDTEDDGDRGDDTKVTLMTLHSAKGLEFPIVFLIGMEDGVFPHLRSLTEPDELEEERRLAYVGITRAMQRLHVSHAWSRQLFGATQYNPPSRFLDEIPEELVEHLGEQRRSGRPSMRSDESWSRGSWGQRTSWADRGVRTASERRAEREQRRANSSFDPDEDDAAAERHREQVVDAALRAGRRAMESVNDDPGLRIGDDVRHGVFGDGVVVALDGRGDKAEAVVRFAGTGEKRLLLSWSPLERLAR